MKIMNQMNFLKMYLKLILKNEWIGNVFLIIKFLNKILKSIEMRNINKGRQFNFKILIQVIKI